jgi:hypothetical protein
VKKGENKTTAEEGLHYKKLKDKYLFKQGLYQDTMLIVIKNDNSLKDNIYTLTIKLKETTDFKLGLNEDLNDGLPEDAYGNYAYRHQMTITMNANLDVPPDFWAFYSSGYGFLSEYFVGLYHPLKCQKFIEIAGIKDGNWRNTNIADRTIYVRQTRTWFRENVREDENGNRLYFEPQY